METPEFKRQQNTWEGHDKKTCNKINYILISTRVRSALLNVKIMPGTDIDGDHVPPCGQKYE